MKNKIMLKDYVGKDNINIKIEIGIRGGRYDREWDKPITRLLKKVYIKKDVIYITWNSEGKMDLGGNQLSNDCGYSGVLICDDYKLDDLYVIAV